MIDSSAPFDEWDNHPDPYEPQICTRLDYHDGPCNGWQRPQCELKNKLEREGKIMGALLTDQEIADAQFVNETTKKFKRGFIGQIWAWVSGRL